MNKDEKRLWEIENKINKLNSEKELLETDSLEIVLEKSDSGTLIIRDKNTESLSKFITPNNDGIKLDEKLKNLEEEGKITLVFGKVKK